MDEYLPHYVVVEIVIVRILILSTITGSVNDVYRFRGWTPK